jgi:hypothetical protein
VDTFDALSLCSRTSSSREQGALQVSAKPARLICLAHFRAHKNSDSNFAAGPNSCSISRRRLYFVIRSLRLAEPVLI